MSNTVKVGDQVQIRPGHPWEGRRGRVTDILPDALFNGYHVVVDFGDTRRGFRPNDLRVDGRRAALAEQVDGHAEVPAPKPAAANDAVFRPAHYARYAIEPITFITANSLGFLPGNVIKYVLRHDAKNGIEDLKKARRYVDIMIEDLERRARGEALKVETV